ncbi:MAG: hypothetical protein PHO27_12050 [Sulfuricurvum sp.]|jgi:hypothetical protein|nr:hypothetical protein [Sulfuricurvum sp.]
MQVDKLSQAITRAKEFIIIAENVPYKMETITANPSSMTIMTIITGKQSAACKRASLELTRALSEMRKP